MYIIRFKKTESNVDEAGPVVATQCSNGIDDDADTFIDLLDPECTNALDNDESA